MRYVYRFVTKWRGKCGRNICVQIYSYCSFSCRVSLSPLSLSHGEVEKGRLAASEREPLCKFLWAAYSLTPPCPGFENWGHLPSPPLPSFGLEGREGGRRERASKRGKFDFRSHAIQSRKTLPRNLIHSAPTPHHRSARMRNFFDVMPLSCSRRISLLKKFNPSTLFRFFFLPSTLKV